MGERAPSEWVATGTSGNRGPLAGRDGVEALPRDRVEALEAVAGTHQEYAETLLQRGRPSATIGWSRTVPRRAGDAGPQPRAGDSETRRLGNRRLTVLGK